MLKHLLDRLYAMQLPVTLDDPVAVGVAHDLKVAGYIEAVIDTPSKSPATYGQRLTAVVTSITPAGLKFMGKD